MTNKDRLLLLKGLTSIGVEAKKFGYVPTRFLQDLARCVADPADLIGRYVRGPPSDGFERLREHGRLDLTVENVAWRHRHLFAADIGAAAERRLAAAGFDVHTQERTPPRRV